MEFFKIARDEMVAVVTLQRPKANALSSKVLKELTLVLDEVEHDDSVRVVVFRGEGRFFSAGADIQEFTVIESAQQFAEYSTYGQSVFSRMEAFPKPLIAAIHGAALGGGLEFAMGCHIRYVTETAKLGLPELQLGIIPGFAGTQRLPQLIGPSRALELLLTSEPITGVQAVEYGLANAAFIDEELHDQVMAIARKMAQKSPLSVKATLELIHYARLGRYEAGMKGEADWFGRAFTSEDSKEGISAFFEKRQPTFTGK